MEKILKDAKEWMKSYMKSFYEDDETVMLGIRTKEIHTWYVTAYARDLAQHLGLAVHDVQLAELMGLFHDVGRFKQWQVYRTFSDAESEDHASISTSVIVTLPVWASLSDEDRDLMLFAINNHNKKNVAPAPSERHLGFAKILRDADKLDIYRVLEPYLDDAYGKGFAKQFIDVTDKESFAPGFLEKFVRAEQVDYNEIKTQNDRKLVRLMWVYDINYAWTMIRLKEKGYIEKIIASLPSNQQTELGFTRLRKHVDDKCLENDKGF